MNAFLIVLCVAVATAEAGYSYPSAPSQGYSDNNGNNNGNTGGVSGNVGGQTFRHVYVHVAPDEPEDQQARVIRIPGEGNKHVNIIFVKTPSGSSNQQTEVILPEQDEQKTLVYVLDRKFDATTDLKIRAPQPTRPTKPAVYFIRYKDGQGAQPAAPSRPVYGAPAF